MGWIFNLGWYMEWIDMWARSFILIGIWNRLSGELMTGSLRGLTCPVAFLIATTKHRGYQERCSVLERHMSVAGAGSESLQRLGALQERGRARMYERCNVWERCRSWVGVVAASWSVAGVLQGHGLGALQRLGELQERCRGKIRSVSASGCVT